MASQSGAGPCHALHSEAGGGPRSPSNGGAFAPSTAIHKQPDTEERAGSPSAQESPQCHPRAGFWLCQSTSLPSTQGAVTALVCQASCCSLGCWDGMAAHGPMHFSLLQEQALGWAGAIVHRLDTGGQHCKEVRPVRWKEPQHARGTWVFTSAIAQPEPSGDSFCPLLPPGRFLLKKFIFGIGGARCRYSPGHALTPNNSSNSSCATWLQTQLHGSPCMGAQAILASLQCGCTAEITCKEMLGEGLNSFSLFNIHHSQLQLNEELCVHNLRDILWI